MHSLHYTLLLQSSINTSIEHPIHLRRYQSEQPKDKTAKLPAATTRTTTPQSQLGASRQDVVKLLSWNRTLYSHSIAPRQLQRNQSVIVFAGLRLETSLDAWTSAPGKNISGQGEASKRAATSVSHSEFCPSFSHIKLGPNNSSS
jgi:hypothetical protein